MTTAVGKMQIQDSFGTTLARITVRYTKKGRLRVNNIYTIHPPKSDLINFYEIVEPGNGIRWGGGDVKSAMQWLYLAPVGSRLLVSAWDSDEEDAHLVGQSIDITELIQHAREVGL